MKRIVSGENYLQLQELSDAGEYKLQLGFPLAGLTYKIENGNVKFYLKDDYFYKNLIWSADLPLNINNVYYDEESVGEGMAGLFDPSQIGVTSINGQQGDVTLGAGDVGAYTTTQVDNLIAAEATARQNADSSLQDTLQDNIDAEEERATQAETDLQTQINSLQSEIENEVDARQSDIEDLQDQIDTLSESSGDSIEVINQEITNISQDITDINEEITQLGDTINNHTTSIQNIEGDIETINQQIETIEGDIENIEQVVNSLQTDNTTNKADIQTLKDDVSALKGRVSSLETASRNHLIASNIKSGTNISVSVSGNDVTINTTGVPSSDSITALEQQVATNTTNIANEVTNRTNADNSILTTLSGKANQSDVTTLTSTVSSHTTAIESIQSELASKEHFKGYFATNAEVQALTGSNGDFAYSAQSGTKWAYNNNTWNDTEEVVPDKTVEKATTNPLMDGTAAIGSSNKYAAADHVHPTDTTRASQSDFSALSQQVSTNTTAIGQKANQSDLTALTTTVNGHTSSIAANATAISNEITRATAAESALSDRINAKQDAGSAFSGDYNDLTNKPTIPTVPSNVSAFTNDAGYVTSSANNLTNYYKKTETYTKSEVDQAIANVDVSGQLSNYYTKSETYSQAEIDQAIANVDVSGQLQNYYTKTESDNKFAVKFTDVDDIRVVQSLPQSPDARTLYLIPE